MNMEGNKMIAERIANIAMWKLNILDQVLNLDILSMQLIYGCITYSEWKQLEWGPRTLIKKYQRILTYYTTNK